MSLLTFFSGPSPEKLEKNGDALFTAGHWGKAKLAYEHALAKLKKRADSEISRATVLEAKIVKTCEALAREHQQNARDLMETDCFDEARELLTLAIEMTKDGQFRRDLERQIQDTMDRQKQNRDASPTDFFYDLGDDDGESPQDSDDEYFYALCNTLPREVKHAYRTYGDDFRTGYLALNDGNFDMAAFHLARAMKEKQGAETYIPLELATAYVHLGRHAEAQGLLEDFLKRFPGILQAYQLLCEIYWDQKAWHEADGLLASVPDDLARSLAFFILKGETLYRSKKILEARNHYRTFLDTYGWNESVAQELGKIYESLGDADNARHMYQTIIQRCKSCHTCQPQINPDIKHRYAELAFDEGQRDSEILELYLSLAQEKPEKATLYFDRISRIYEAQGNTSEAERFRSFFAQTKTEKEK